MKRFFSSLAAVIVAVVMMFGYVPVVEVRADGMVSCRQMTIAAGITHSMAIMSDGNLWAWGDNRFGQLGNGTTTNQSSPVRIMDNVKAVSVGGGSERGYIGGFIGHTMAIRTDGSLWACA